MVVTSFHFGRKYLTQKQWKLLHKSGIYFLWAYPFSVYWWNLSYYANPEPIDYVFYWSGFLAFAVRIAAWGKKRRQVAKRRIRRRAVRRSALKVLGSALIIAFGLFVSATGLDWQEPVTAVFDRAEVVCGSCAVDAFLAFRTLFIPLHYWVGRRPAHKGQGLNDYWRRCFGWFMIWFNSNSCRV